MSQTLWFGRPAWEVIAWIILILIILWALKQEYRESHCYDGLSDCGPVFAWDPQPDDSVADLVRRIEYANRGETFIITRRIVMIAAAGLALVMMWYFDKKKRVVPNIVEYVIVFVIVMGVIWFTFRYHESHYLHEIDRRMDKSIQALRYKLGLATEPKNVGL